MLLSGSGSGIYNKQVFERGILMGHRKKKVLIFLYDMEIGGIERSLVHMLEHLDYSLVEVDLFICRHTGDLLHMVPDKVNLLPESSAYAAFRKPMAQSIREGQLVVSLVRLLCKVSARLYSRLKRHTEGAGYTQMQLTSRYMAPLLPVFDQEYDLAIGYAWPHDVVATKVRAKKKIAWIHTDYSQIEIHNGLDLRLWSGFDHIMSISEACTQSFLAQYPSLADRIIQLENITSPTWIRDMADTPTSSATLAVDSFNLVSVGRLSYVKGFDMAIEALRLLHDRGMTDIRWYVVGFGSMESELERRISELGLEGKFVMLGKQVNPYPYMKACDVYAQPSRYEGKAVTVTEAQILGKPVLITNYPTAGSQVVDEVDGLICQADAQGIADGVERMYRDRELRDRIAATLRSKDFGNSEQLQKLYQIIA